MIDGNLKETAPALAATVVLGLFGCIDHPDDFATAPRDAGHADASPDTSDDASPDTDCSVDEQAVCETAGADCGVVQIVDPCMELQHIPCGDCLEGTYCGGENTCLPGRSIDGLLALYTFAEGDGEIVYDQSGDPEVHLQFHGEGDEISWVEHCDCVRFDDGKLRGDDTTGLYEHIKTGSQEFTMEIWMESDIYSPSSTPTRTVALSGGTGSHNFVFGTDHTQIETRFHNVSGGSNDQRNWGEVLTEDLHHFAVVLTDGDQIHLYRDGTRLETQSTTSDMSSWDESMPLLVGNEQGFDRAWHGTAHLVALYDRALDESEVEHHFELGPVDP